MAAKKGRGAQLGLRTELVPVLDEKATSWRENSFENEAEVVKAMRGEAECQVESVDVGPTHDLLHGGCPTGGIPLLHLLNRCGIFAERGVQWAQWLEDLINGGQSGAHDVAALRRRLDQQ